MLFGPHACLLASLIGIRLAKSEGNDYLRHQLREGKSKEQPPNKDLLNY